MRSPCEGQHRKVLQLPPALPAPGDPCVFAPKSRLRSTCRSAGIAGSSHSGEQGALAFCGATGAFYSEIFQLKAFAAPPYAGTFAPMKRRETQLFVDAS